MPDRAVLVEADALTKVFATRGSDRATDVVAVKDLSFAVREGRSLGIVGESGSGKTTVARMIMRLETPSAGRITVCGSDLTTKTRRRATRRASARDAQIVFQDPYSSLDPRQTVGAAISEVLGLHTRLSRPQRGQRVVELLEQVGLDPGRIGALPRMLSGGQRQRVAIARALAISPRLLILDEAVAALDVSIQAQVLNLLADLRDETGMTYILISHDLAVVRQLTSEVIVMRHGEAIERGQTGQVLDTPSHPYTRQLKDAVPRPGWKPRARAVSIAAAAFPKQEIVPS